MDFRKKLLALGFSAMAFAGMSYAQTACTGPTNTTGPANLLRLEGTNELVTDITVTCTGATVNTGSLIVTLNANVTSKVAAPGVNEATLRITGEPNLSGVVSGNQVSFANAIFPVGPFTIQISNVRVNANSAPVNTYVTASLLVTNNGVVAFSLLPQQVGYVQQGFAVPSLTLLNPPAPNAPNTNPVNYAICTANSQNVANVSFQVTVAENFGGAFKTQTGAGLCGPAPGVPCSTTNGEQGSYVPGAPSAVGTANSGTRFQFSFTGIPSGATIYLPTVVPNGPLTFTMTASATGPLTPVAANVPAGSAIPAGYTPLTAANGAATAIYEVTATDNTVLAENVNVKGIVIAAANFANTAQPAISLTVTPAPTGSTNVPNFGTSSNPALTLTAFSVCQTSLLFPYAVSQLGFDTGIVLSNTSTDPFAPGASATPQSGSCTLNFYGAGAPTPSTGVAAPGGTQATGTVSAFLLSSVAPGFQGYIIAQCNYLYGHGFAYIEYGMPNNNGTAMGYLAEVLQTRPIVGAGTEKVEF